MKQVFLLLSLIFMTNGALAGGQTGVITGIQVRDDGLHWLQLSGTRNGRPPCAIHNYWMIKDENSVYGKSQFSMLLSAYMTGKTVVISGKNTCSRWGDGEDIRTVQLKK